MPVEKQIDRGQHGESLKGSQSTAGRLVRYSPLCVPDDITVASKRIGAPVGYRRPTARRSVDYLVYIAGTAPASNS